MFGNNKEQQSFHITPVKKVDDGPGFMTWVIGIFAIICLFAILGESDAEECSGVIDYDGKTCIRDGGPKVPEFD